MNLKGYCIPNDYVRTKSRFCITDDLIWRHFEISRVYPDDPRSTRAAEFLGVTNWRQTNASSVIQLSYYECRFFKCLFAGVQRSLTITRVMLHGWFTRICAPWFWWHSPRRLVEINVQMILVHTHVDVFLKTSKNYCQLRSENDWQVSIKSCTSRCQWTRGSYTVSEEPSKLMYILSSYIPRVTYSWRKWQVQKNLSCWGHVGKYDTKRSEKMLIVNWISKTSDIQNEFYFIIACF